jgi:LuxR family maltose regulon positive regulatory protein
VAAVQGVIPATKLHVPRVRAGIVPREGLVELLVRGRSRKLTLLGAPAGFGKTTLLAEWCASAAEECDFAWVSLDPADNDPVRFWTCAIDALDGLAPGTGAEARSALRASRGALEDVALPLLLNDLARLERPAVLVLDDYHQIRDERVHESVDYLVQHLPDALHLAIATRSDPPLPLGRLRARGELTEVRAAELRLSAEESAALLRAALGVELDASDVARLVSRTEGWAAGLYLAALSLRGRSDARAFIASFTGDDRHIVDYLSSEVLAGQPPGLRGFLLETSVLERLCGPLCDAVTGRGDSAELLERIERDNLFVTPLDTTREWYRYHLLFGELLHHELQRSQPERMAELHRRARDWYRAEGAIPEAIEHATAAGDVDDAARLIAAHWNDYFNRGHLDTVDGWLTALPPETVAGDPRLCMARAWLALDWGAVDVADRWIESAQARLDSDAGEAWDAGDRADAAVLRSTHGFKTGDLERAEEAALHVLRLAPEGATFPRFVAHCILGVTRHWRGAHADAVTTLEHALRIAESDGNQLGQSYALGYLALARGALGDVGEADELSRRAIGLSEAGGFGEHFVAMIGQLASGQLEERRGELEDAQRSLVRALALARRGAGALELGAALIALAQVSGLRGDRAGARALLAEAREIVEGCADAGTLGASLAAAEAALRAPSRRAGRTPAGRDELTEREIDPIRLVSVGHTYVEAWCRRSEARRTFRLDRVAEIRILDEPSAPPEIELRDLSEGLVQPAAEDPEVVVEVGPGGRWVAEYYPHDSADELADGGLRITLRTPDPTSLRRLALRLGRDGRIVSPHELADSARRAAREALAAYDGLEAAGAEKAHAGHEGQYDRRE